MTVEQVWAKRYTHIPGTNWMLKPFPMLVSVLLYATSLPVLLMGRSRFPDSFGSKEKMHDTIFYRTPDDRLEQGKPIPQHKTRFQKWKKHKMVRLHDEKWKVKYLSGPTCPPGMFSLIFRGSGWPPIVVMFDGFNTINTTIIFVSFLWFWTELGTHEARAVEELVRGIRPFDHLQKVNQ